MMNDPLFLVAANVGTAFLFRILKPNVLTAVLLAVVLIASTGYLGKHYGTEVLATVYRGRDAVLTYAGSPPTWPPEKYRSYPDLELVDQTGRRTKLSEFRGKILLIEPVGMSCRACVAFAGGHERGAFWGVTPQENLESIAKCAQEYGSIQLEDDEIVHLQIVLFNSKMEAPSEHEVRMWAQHFGLDRARNRIVLAGSPAMANLAGRDLIPGFHLVDKHFMLRADSTGAKPEDNLYSDLLPLIWELRKESATTLSVSSR
jgi:hypothetical protein